MSDLSFVDGSGVQLLLQNSKTQFENSHSFQSYTVNSSGWNSSTKQYSFESTYPSSTYDIIGVVLDQSATLEQRNAFMAADVGGHYSTNIMIAHGTVPSVNIPVVLTVKHK